MKRTTSAVTLITLVALAVAMIALPAWGARYMRVFYLQPVHYGLTSDYGDSIYIEFPGADGVLDTYDDKNLLLDGGVGTSAATNAISAFLDSKLTGFPYYNTLYFMVLSHPHTDHLGGLKLAVVDYNVINFYETSEGWPPGATNAYDSLISDLGTEGANMYGCYAGDILSGPSTDKGPGWDPNIEARVLCAYSSATKTTSWQNQDSLVFNIYNGNSCFLFGGDAYTTPNEGWIQNETAPHSYAGAWNELSRTDFYKVQHHGSSGASSAAYLTQMSPQYAVNSTGHGTSTHPNVASIDRIYTAGAIEYRNDLDHHIEVRCDDNDNYEITRWMYWTSDTSTEGSGAMQYSPPNLVTGLSVVVQDTAKIALAWVDGGYDYNVYRSTFSGGTDAAGTATQPGLAEATGIYEKRTSSPVSFATWTDTDFVTKQPYYYRVSSLGTVTVGTDDQTQERRWSNEVEAYVSGAVSPTPIGYKTIPPSPTRTPTPTPTPSRSPSPTRSASPTPYSSDILENMSFEDAPDLVYWEEEGTTASVNKSGLAWYDGSYSCVFVDPTTSFTGRGVYSNYINVTAMNNYYFSGWFDTAFETETGLGVANTEFRFNVHWYSATFSEVDSETSTFTLSAYDTWENQSYPNLNAPVGSSFARARVNIREILNSNNDGYIDYFQFGGAPETPSPTRTPCTPTPTPTPIPDYYLKTTLTAGGPVYSVYADGTYIYGLSGDPDNHIYLWDYSSPWPFQTDLTQAGWTVTNYGGVYADDTYFYAGGDDCTLLQWIKGTLAFSASTDTGVPILNIYGDGSSYIFAAHDDGNVVRHAEGNLNTITALSNAGTCRFDVFVDSYYVYAADSDKKLYLWKASDLSFNSSFSPQSAGNWATESKAMTAVCATGDGDYIYAGNGNDNLYVWDGDTLNYNTRKDFATETINAVASNRNYFYGASGDSNVYVYTEGYWNLTTSLTNGTAAMWDVYADTEYILGACGDNKIYVWKAPDTPSPTPTPTAFTTTPTPTLVPNLSIVINEVAWMGTSAQSSDEWLEFYNPPGGLGDTSLETWSVSGVAASGGTLNLQSANDAGFVTYTIADGGYLAYVNDNAVFCSGGTMQLVDAGISLSNSDCQLVLYDAFDGAAGGGNVVDIANQPTGAWFAGTNPSGNPAGRATMERINPEKYGTYAGNWGTFSGTVIAWCDAAGCYGDILGSPGAQNSVYSLAPSPAPTAYVITPTPTVVGYNTPPPTPTPQGYHTPVKTPTPAEYGNVVFNELCWMGTKAKTSHEWIELYIVDDGGSFVNFSGWSIVGADGYPNFTIQSDTSFSTGGYALFERWTDNTVSNIPADFVYPYNNALETEGESLYLKNASNEVVDHLSMENGWMAGDNDYINGVYYTMERKWPAAPSSVYWNWASWDTSFSVGSDANGNDLQGTARSQNTNYSAAPTPAATPTPWGPDAIGDVVFNEIAWMGTKVSSIHEWFELRNNTTAAINLKGFRVYTKTNYHVDFTIDSDLIVPYDPSNGYYFALLKRGYDQVVRNYSLQSNWQYVYPVKNVHGQSNLMSNDGEWLVLESNGVIWDEIDWNPSNWPAGTVDPYYYTMEKITPQASGSEPYNWENNDGIAIAGVDAVDAPIDGTAGVENGTYNPTALRVQVIGVVQPGQLDPKGRYPFFVYPLTDQSGGEVWYLVPVAIPIDQFVGQLVKAEGVPVYAGEYKFLKVEMIQSCVRPVQPSPTPREVGPAPTPQPIPTPIGAVPTPRSIPTPSGPVPTPAPGPEDAGLARVESMDYDGDGRADIAVFRPESGLWVIRDLSRFYFGAGGDLPVSGDYDGDGSTDVAIYRSETGLWAIRELSRAYFGTAGDIPVPGDYNGDGYADLAVFRPAASLWVARGITRAYFGGASDNPIPGDYNGDGTIDLAVFLPAEGRWAIYGISRFYLGALGDIPAPADFRGEGTETAAVFRPVGGLWVVRGWSRLYFGGEGDIPVIGDFDGDRRDDIAVFRPGTGLWSVRGGPRFYQGRAGDIPLTK